MSTISYSKPILTSIDNTDFDKANSPMTSTIANDTCTSILTATRTPSNLASDWPSAEYPSGGWIDHGMDGDEGDDDDSDDPEEQEQFDRISGILSQLIQEANNAINSSSSGQRTSTPTMTEYEDQDDDDAWAENASIMENGDGDDKFGWTDSNVEDIISEVSDDFNNMDEEIPVRTTSPLPIQQLQSYEPQVSNIVMMERTASASTAIRDSRRRSRLPRPKKLSLDILQHRPSSYHNRSSSMISTSSSSSSNMDYDDDSLFSPMSSSLATPMSRTISPLLFEKGLYTQLSRQGSNIESDLAILCGRAVQNHRQRDDNESGTEEEYSSHPHDKNEEALMSPSGSLMASFERLDSSLAIVDSLSRDLASYRRQHPRHRNSTSIHPMTTTYSHDDPLNDIALDSITSELMENQTISTTTETTTIPSDDNSYTNQHYDEKSSASRKWIAVFIVGPILYIPYLLMASLWEQMMVTTGTSTTTTPFSLLLSTASAMMFDDRHTFASLKSTLITTLASTAVIDDDGIINAGMVPPFIGLAVFLLFLAILYLLKVDCVTTMDQDCYDVLSTDGADRQFMDTYSYNDQSKIIRRSSLPMMPCSPSLSRRNSF